MSERITRMLKNYKSYRYAVSNGIAPYEEGESIFCASGYGSRPPAGLMGRGSLLPSMNDFTTYSRAVNAIDGAVREVLNDEEQSVIRYKYMERNTLTLAQIADKFNMCERRAQYLHKKALKALTLALKFVDEPEIINLDAMIDGVKIYKKA